MFMIVNTSNLTLLYKHLFSCRLNDFVRDNGIKLLWISVVFLVPVNKARISF